MHAAAQPLDARCACLNAAPAIHVRRAYCGGGGGSKRTAKQRTSWRDCDSQNKELFMALLLSRLGNPTAVHRALQADWTETWAGWDELDAGNHDGMEALASRFLQIAEANAGGDGVDDDERVRALRRDGFELVVASAHGMNNCLIDTIMLCLALEGVLPEALLTAAHASERGEITQRCRDALVVRGCPAAAPRDGLYPFLDAERDGPFIVEFLLREFAVPCPGPLRLKVFDRFCEPGNNEIVLTGSRASTNQRSTTLYAYNSTTEPGQGYHFDAMRKAKRDALQSACAPPELPTAASAPAMTPGNDLVPLLQHFFLRRGANIWVNAFDAQNVRDHWDDVAALGQVLTYLLQAGLCYADIGRKAQRRLAEQWLTYYYSTCTHGPGIGLRMGSTASIPDDSGAMPRLHAPKASRRRRRAQKRGRLSARMTGRRKARGTESLQGRKCQGENPKVQLRKRIRGKRSATGLEERNEANSKTLEGAIGPRKRLRRKTHPAGAPERDVEPSLDGDEFELRTNNADQSWQARWERAIMTAAAACRCQITVPLAFEGKCAADLAHDLPACHCAFAACEFCCDSEDALLQHVAADHAELCQPLLQMLEARMPAEERVRAAYGAVLSHVSQKQAPQANPSIDRRCLRAFRTALQDRNLQELVCFVCARRYPHLPSVATNQEIRWRRLVTGDAAAPSILGVLLQDMKGLLSLQRYQEKYATQCNARPRPSYGRT